MVLYRMCPHELSSIVWEELHVAEKRSKCRCYKILLSSYWFTGDIDDDAWMVVEV